MGSPELKLAPKLGQLLGLRNPRNFCVQSVSFAHIYVWNQFFNLRSLAL